MGKLIIAAGAALIVLGLIVTLAERFGFGGMPGDFTFERGNMRFYFPLGSSLLLSVIISLALWFFRR